MNVSRCTAWLHKIAESWPSTTALGDWHGNVFNFGRQPPLILTSDKPFLSVVLPARGLHIAKTPYNPLPDCYPRDVVLKQLDDLKKRGSHR